MILEWDVRRAGVHILLVTSCTRLNTWNRLPLCCVYVCNTVTTDNKDCTNMLIMYFVYSMKFPPPYQWGGSSSEQWELSRQQLRTNLCINSTTSSRISETGATLILNRLGDLILDQHWDIQWQEKVCEPFANIWISAWIGHNIWSDLHLNHNNRQTQSA